MNQKEGYLPDGQRKNRGFFMNWFLGTKRKVIYKFKVIVVLHGGG